MRERLLWLPDVLSAAGLKVAAQPGWRTRGGDDIGPVLGVICHFTGTTDTRNNMPTLRALIDGRTDPPLAGPLSQLGLGRDGTYYIIASGRANHAGKGAWNGITTGNGSFIGIEAENSGRKSDPWPSVQLDAYHRGAAALLRHMGRTAASCCGHREWALPVGRKPDPNFGMNLFRVSVAAILNGTAPAPVLIPPVEPGGKARPTIRRGSTGPFVTELQQRLRVPNAAGINVFGPATEAAVREFQRTHGLVPDGIVGPKCWEALDHASP